LGPDVVRAVRRGGSVWVMKKNGVKLALQCWEESRERNRTVQETKQRNSRRVANRMGHPVKITNFSEPQPGDIAQKKKGGRRKPGMWGDQRKKKFHARGRAKKKKPTNGGGLKGKITAVEHVLKLGLKGPEGRDGDPASKTPERRPVERGRRKRRDVMVRGSK